MNSNPLVSIVIPVYNGANYVGEAIDSALAQTYRNTEVIVVDDGSTDDGAAVRVIKGFGDRVRLISKPNGGVATALNAGIENMRGQLFSWLSHDDLYRPEKVERQVEAWRRFGQPCVVIGDFDLMDADGVTTAWMSIQGYNLVARPLDAVFFGLINGCALLVPRELFDRAGLFEPGLPTTQDYHLWYRLARLVPFVYCPDAGVRQRVHDLQGSRQSSHLDEAGRLFAHLVDITPPRLMQAYDGSELRFLLRVRKALDAYPGLTSYLTYRTGQLMREVRYSVVVWNDGEDVPEVDVASLKSMAKSPARIVMVRIGMGGSHTRSAAGAEDVLVSATPEGTHPADVLDMAAGVLPGGIVIFVRASRIAPESQLISMLEEFIAADADVARPLKAPEMLPALDGLFVRHDALRALADALRETDIDWESVRDKLRTAEYESIVLPPILGREAVTKALCGQERIDYHRRVCEGAIGRLIREMFDPQLPVVLFLMHSEGGGAQTHLSSLMRALKGKANSLTIYGRSTGELHLSVESDNVHAGLVFRIPEQLPDLVRILRRAGVARIDIHHMMGFEGEAEMLVDALGVPFDVTLVDYHLVANNRYLCLNDGRFAGDSRLRDPELKLLRRVPLPILRKASRVIAISRDLAARIDKLCPGLPLTTARLWHDSPVRMRHVLAPRVWADEPLRVVLVGAIAPHKGQAIAIEVARAAAARDLPIRLHVMGELAMTPADQEDVGQILTVHGRYQAAVFAEVLGGIAPHVGWLPSQTPETWSYALTDLMDVGLPIAATGIGAIPERCQGRPYTWLLPWDAQASHWVDLFLRLHSSGLQEAPRWISIDDLPPVRPIYFDEYLYGRLHAMGASTRENSPD